jgi:hypothetical protein
MFVVLLRSDGGYSTANQCGMERLGLHVILLGSGPCSGGYMQVLVERFLTPSFTLVIGSKGFEIAVDFRGSVSITAMSTTEVIGKDNSKDHFITREVTISAVRAGVVGNYGDYLS